MRTSTAVDLSPEREDEVVDLEERSWLPRYCNGDHTAFAQLLAAYQRPLYSYLTRCGLRPEARDDLFQEIFLKVHHAAHTYQAARPLRPWLFTIAVNTVRNHLRQEHQQRHTASTEDVADIVDSTAGAEAQAATRELISWLQQALAALPLAQRHALVLISIEGLRQQDVAEILQLPLNTVKTHLRRARITLSKALAERDSEARSK